MEYNFEFLLRNQSITTSVQSKLSSITHVAAKVHVISRSFVVLTWMRVAIELV